MINRYASSRDQLVQYVEVALCLLIAGMFYAQQIGSSFGNIAHSTVLITLPVLGAICLGLFVSRARWNIILLLCVTTFYFTLRFKVGDSNLMRGGDRDDALVQVSRGLIHWHYPYDEHTFLGVGQRLSTGPTSGILAVPFVRFFGTGDYVNLVFVGFMMAWFLKKRPQLQFLSLAMALLVFLPFLNRAYWDSCEELLWGWAFLIPATLLVKRRVAENDAFFTAGGAACGVLLGLGIGVRIAYAIPAFYLVLYLLLSDKWRTALTAGMISLVTFVLLSLPFVLMSGVDHYVRMWMMPVWFGFGGQNSGLKTALVVLIFSLALRRVKMPPEAGVVLSAAVGHWFAGLFLIPWQAYYWVFPALFWMPDVMTNTLSRFTARQQPRS